MSGLMNICIDNDKVKNRMTSKNFAAQFVEVFVKEETNEVPVERSALSDMEDECELEKFDAGTEQDDLTLLEVAIVELVKSVRPAHFYHMLCPRCGKEFATAPLWQQHLDNVHHYNNLNMLPIKCSEADDTCSCRKCEATFRRTNYRQILLHCLMHMRHSAYYKCALCEHLVSNEEQMEQHIRRHTQVHLLKAKADSKILKAKKLMLNNEIVYEEYLRYVCPSCGQHFPTQQTWRHHATEQHGLFVYENFNYNFTTVQPQKDTDLVPAARTTTCKICSSTLLCKELRSCQLQHYLIHMRFRAFRCTICKMRFSYSAEIKLHMQLLHCKNLQYLHRSVLPAVLRNISLPFDVHQSFMLGAGAQYAAHWQFDCPVCGMRFLQSNAWYEHINANHDFFKPAYMALHFSDVSPSTAAPVGSKGKPLNHVRQKVQRPVPFCLICNRRVDRYTGYRSVWVELLRHMPYPAFGCHICDENFNRLHLVMKHYRKHHIQSDGSLKTEKRQAGRRKRKSDNVEQEDGLRTSIHGNKEINHEQ